MKIKPFCVKSSDLTTEELNQMLEACVELGAKQHEWVKGFDKSSVSEHLYVKGDYTYWGVDVELRTYTCDRIDLHGNNILSKEEAFSMLKEKNL